MLFEKTDGFYDQIFNKSTKTEYILLPYLFWDNQDIFIEEVSNKYDYRNYRNLNLLALSVLGEIFKKTFSLNEKPTRSEKVEKILKLAVENIKGYNESKKKKFSNKIWKPILETLLSIAESRRKDEVKLKELGSIEEISIRNIIVKMVLSDSNLKTTIMSKP